MMVVCVSSADTSCTALCSRPLYFNGAQALILQHVHHPNIVMYLGSWISASELTIAMEYCSSGDLFNFIAKRRVVLPAASRPRQSSGADGAGPAHGHDGGAHGYVTQHTTYRDLKESFGASQDII